MWLAITILVGLACGDGNANGDGESACQAALQMGAEFIAENNVCETNADCTLVGNSCYLGEGVAMPCGGVGLNPSAVDAWTELLGELELGPGSDPDGQFQNVCAEELEVCGGAACPSCVHCYEGRCTARAAVEADACSG
jgi:hypothetical protein